MRFQYGANANANSHHDKGTLLIDKINSSLPLHTLVSGIYVADSVEAGLKLCESLNADESVVTKDGVWMNRAWLKILRQEDPAAGCFSSASRN